METGIAVRIDGLGGGSHIAGIFSGFVFVLEGFVGWSGGWGGR